MLLNQNIIAFDFPGNVGSAALKLTNEQVLSADWARGPAGTGELDLTLVGYYGMDYFRGVLAESWEFPELGTFIFHIRKGVHYALNPNSEASRLVNGREFTTDDAVFNFTRNFFDPRGKIRTSPAMVKAMTITKTDANTVVIKTPVDPQTGLMMVGGGVNMQHFPPEVIQKYGDMFDWRNSVGTGPYMLTDFVSSASATLIRNPNYWDKDPVGPGKGNQLPYIDTVKLLIVTDVSTRMAAIRTGRADWVTEVTLEDARSLKKTTPNLQFKRYYPDAAAPVVIGMRQDKATLPVHDVRVRQALMMAIDFKSLKNDLYGGEAEILVWPMPPVKGYEKAYMPMEELPANVQELYSYKPDKAKQLLADAGYPNGFKPKIIVSATPASDVDFLSVIKAMWAKIGVDLEIQPREYAVYISQAEKYDEMKLQRVSGVTTCTTYQCLVQMGTNNPSWIDDPKIIGVSQEAAKVLFVNEAKAFELFRGMLPYLLSQAYVIPRPTPYGYTFWWPWVKNYHGELNAIYRSEETSWLNWAWIDQDLRQQMTGRR